MRRSARSTKVEPALRAGFRIHIHTREQPPFVAFNFFTASGHSAKGAGGLSWELGKAAPPSSAVQRQSVGLGSQQF